MKFIEYLKNERIKYEFKNRVLIVLGSLDLGGSRVTEIPENMAIGGSLYLGHHGKFVNIAFRQDCGNKKRTIFAARMADGVKIFAGCFQGTIEEFEHAVNDEYSGEEAEKYIAAGRECYRGVKNDS